MNVISSSNLSDSQNWSALGISKAGQEEDWRCTIGRRHVFDTKVRPEALGPRRGHSGEGGEEEGIELTILSCTPGGTDSPGVGVS